MAKGNVSETNKGPERNVVWTGEGEVPHTVSIGMEAPIALTLTDSDARAGFYHPEAGLLIAHNDGFKEFRPDKGVQP